MIAKASSKSTDEYCTAMVTTPDRSAGAGGNDKSTDSGASTIPSDSRATRASNDEGTQLLTRDDPAGFSFAPTLSNPARRLLFVGGPK
ncbi:hypothetical protein BJI47_09480 [Rhodococcus sp. 1168]|nr:hypothetical protein BJI47_09480 [Rhodococcus sp. 1168]